MKENSFVAVGDDGMVRINYWNKAAGEINIYCSKEEALKMQKSLKSELRPHVDLFSGKIKGI